MSFNHNPDTDTAEFIELCEAYLSATHDLVLAHIESSRTTNTGLSPRDQAFTLQQRAHFFDHLHVSVGYLESLIEHQGALAAIFHGRPINPHTGLPIFYPAVIPTAHRVSLDCSAETVPPQTPRNAPRSHHRCFPFPHSFLELEEISGHCSTELVSHPRRLRRILPSRRRLRLADPP